MSYHVIYQFTDVNGHLDKMCIIGDDEKSANEKAKKIIRQNKGKNPKLIKEHEIKGA